MPRPKRFAFVLALAAISVGSSLLGGCAMTKKAPVLTQAQLTAGIIGKKHPVDQAKATQMGCSCHLGVAKKVSE
jgi:hypothetical protein